MNSKTCGRGCQQSWDVRCCCELNCPKKNSNEQFYNCPVKLNTAYFHIGNNFKYCEYANNDDWKKITKNFKLNNKELEQIKEWWVEDNKDSYTDSNF